MQAAYYERQGAAHDVLMLGELPDPAPGAGEVRVRLSVSGLNPTDIKARAGFAGAPMRFPRVIPHQDGAGIIDRVGDGVSESRIGQRVWIFEAQTGRAGGTAAGFTVVPSANAVPLPDGISFDVGACLGIAAMTAHRCLFADGDIRGQRVLVHGGAGAVGTATILLAKWAGSWVATTVSRSEQAVVARRAGADLIIFRKHEDVSRQIKAAGADAVDRIVDVDLVSNLGTNLACLAPNGVVCGYATEEPSVVLPIPFLRAMLRGFVFRFVFVYAMPEAARRQAIEDIGDCLVSGGYHPEIGLRFPLSKIAEAHEAQERRAAIGKILVSVAEDGDA
jgi:NADPH2:quinone reductase